MVLQRIWGHDVDLLESPDVISQVTIGLAIYMYVYYGWSI